MATSLDNKDRDLSVFFPDVLKRIWKDDKERDWNVYLKELKFAYFWDNRDIVDQKK